MTTQTQFDRFRLTELVYVLINALISFFCFMSCKHIIFKLKTVFSSVCASVLAISSPHMQMRIEVAKNIALLLTNTLLLLVVLLLRIATSLYPLSPAHT